MALPGLVVTIQGTAALEARLGALSGPQAAQVLERATMAGALLILNDAQRHAPVVTGTLRRSLHAEVIESTRLAATVTVGTNLVYAPYVEYGTRAHVILPKDKQALWWKGAEHPVARVNHPGTKAQPFLEPALTRNIPAVRAEIMTAIDLLLSRA
jgi:HK97 gp10 family phage protein